MYAPADGQVRSPAVVSPTQALAPTDLRARYASTSDLLDYPTIAIIGGGPSGLVALLTLLTRGIPATLYERETSSAARAYLGGMLDLTWNEGQRALRENGLAEAFKANSRLDAQDLIICGKDGIPLMRRTEDDVKDETQSRPEIDRRVLRDIMLAALPESAVKWGHALASVRPLEEGSGRHELTFTSGLVVVTDILIGADGARSRVRPLVSPAKPIYHGITGAEISVSPTVAALPENTDILKGVGRGSCYAAQDGKTFMLQLNGNGRIRVYALHRAPLEWALPREPQEARRVLLDIYKDWAPWMRKVIEVCDDDAIYHRPLFYLPVGHRWAHKRGVTIIGDAAHLMSPFAGAGANLAMFDGLELGLVLADAVAKGLSAEEREAAVAAVEEKICAHAETFAAKSYRNVDIYFGPGAPQAVVDAFTKARR
ncbi:fumarate reductase/succinate dehydrogenase flavo protein domain protein [Polyporus arcularius HHB13444]|uniref:Fumarate reductase/succinate dehydrogenase flavo protein domain protein n=1 Tax=Polyporus arcularius HHB13444 TaxID=1314778 RepID=A0A5C3P165_9APHY|nr:fumarate reductase/succinate dehydrogenase flavo protein domain protein [Polyporus arcularius HHB13444]